MGKKVRWLKTSWSHVPPPEQCRVPGAWDVDLSSLWVVSASGWKTGPVVAHFFEKKHVLLGPGG